METEDVAKKMKSKKIKDKAAPGPVVRKRDKQFTMWLTGKERKRLKIKAQKRGFASTGDYVRQRCGLEPVQAPTKATSSAA